MDNNRMIFWLIVLVAWTVVGALTASWLNRRFSYHRRDKTAWAFTSLLVVVAWPLVWFSIWFDNNFPHDREEQ